ncbi:TonB-dependent receptor [Bosea sp. TWI1241]|uniref:TonB-dependent receptor n=1 Tax=Bosea sp. TWI1241 TaxID=3148904 RepID=UPI00320A3E13
MRIGLSFSLFGAALLSVLPHRADADPAPAGNDATITLDTITITARKRSEDAFDVPGGVTVVQGGALASSSVDPGAEIARQVPNFNFVDFAQPGQNFTTMRGIGPLGAPLNSLDNTVGFAVDGVPTTMFGFSPTLLDVERVEVLRGPQGTLFGRNALGGMVNVVTAPADGKRIFRATGEIGSNGHALGEVIAGGWLLPDQLAGRAALRIQRYGGDIPNLVIGGKQGEADVAAGRATLRWTPSGDVDVTFTGGYERDERNNLLAVLDPLRGRPFSGVDSPVPAARRTAHGALTISRRFDALSFTSVTGYQDIRIKARTDDTDAFVFARVTGLPPTSFNDPSVDWSRAVERERVFSQEFRLNSAEGSRVTWVAGLHYFRSEYGQNRIQDSTTSPISHGSNRVEILSETFAGFADVSLPLTERLTLSGGARYAFDRARLNANWRSSGFPGTVPVFDQRGRYSDPYLTGRMALSYKWSDTLNSYVSVARGYASGGFERYTVNAPYGLPSEPFRSAKGWSYEIGAKSRLFGGRIDLAAAAFYNDIKDGQMMDFDPSTFAIFYANQDFRSYGLEIEGRARIGDRLEIGGGLGLTRSEMRGVSPTTLTGARNGNPVPLVPRVTANASIQYTLPGLEIGMPGRFVAKADYQFVGSRAADVARRFDLRPYHIVNTQLSWENETLKVYAFGRNLLDQRPEYFGALYGADARGLIIGRGRYFGAGVSATF